MADVAATHRWARSQRANVTLRHDRPSGEASAGADEWRRIQPIDLLLEPDTSVSGVSQPEVATTDSSAGGSSPQADKGKDPRMTETTDAAPTEAAPASSARKGGGLNAMLLPELKQLAGGLGIKSTGMRKGALIEAIKSAQEGQRSPDKPRHKNSSKAAAEKPDAATVGAAARPPSATPESQRRRRRRAPAATASRTTGRAGRPVPERPGPQNGRPRTTRPRTTAPRTTARRTGTHRTAAARTAAPGPTRRTAPACRTVTRTGANAREDVARRRRPRGQRPRAHEPGRQRPGDNDRGQNDRAGNDRAANDRNQGGGNQGGGNQGRQPGRPQPGRHGNQDRNQAAGNQDRNQPAGNRGNVEDDGDGSRRNRRRRGRDRNERNDRNDRPQTGGNQGGGNPRGNRNEPDMQVLEDDVLAPCAGILDLMDNYAFVRTSGYLPGSDDVYVSMSMVRKFGLRRGDAVTGQVRQPREGERKEKYNPLVKLDSVNGADPEEAKQRVEFSKLTPLYPSERLRLETSSTNLIGRVIDIAAPIGKGQRGLIVSPSKAGKTMIMQSIANSITTNNPECHLMVVLVDERPEEVTDFERSVKGEVVSSTFDRPASDHTIVAELAIERAKRLVELGHDVVVLLDGITRLGRAYNLAAPASGRILSGGVDSAALYPPKRFFGAARNIEDGGSLTILATALIESGSKMDEVIFEEFKGTGNMEIRLRRDFADKRIFPAIDAVQSGTRREELLMSKEELSIVWKLRRVLSGLDGQQALELLLERLKKSQNNLEFLMQVQKTTPTAGTQND